MQKLILSLLFVVLTSLSALSADYNLISDIPDERRYAFYPGSFDPPHRSHFQTVRELIEDHGFEKVFIPVNTRGPKNYTASIEERVQMVKEMYREFGDKVEVFLEPQEGKDFLKDKLIKRVGARVFAITGGDGWDLLPEEVKDDLSMSWVVMPRPELDAEDNYPLRDNLYVLKRKDYGNGVSSSEIRAALKNNETTSDIPASTFRLMQGLGLYYHSPDQVDEYEKQFIREWNHITESLGVTDLERPELKEGQSPKAWRENFLRMISLHQKQKPAVATSFFLENADFVFGGEKITESCGSIMRAFLKAL